MTGLAHDLESPAVKRHDHRQVLHVSKHCQLVVLSIPPDDETGDEVHARDQFFRVETGTGAVVLNGITSPIEAGCAVLVPAGVRRSFINTGPDPLALYVLDDRPNQRDGGVHRTRAEADVAEEYFDTGSAR